MNEMTFTHFTEYVQQHHSGIGGKEIRLLLNTAASDFCRRTEIHRAVWNIKSVAGQRYYQLSNMHIKILKVQIDDVEIPRLLGDPIVDDDDFAGDTLADAVEAASLATPTTSSNERYWYPSLDRIGIVEKATNAVTRDGKTSDYQSMSVSDKEISIYIIGYPKGMVATDSYTSTDVAPFNEIPRQFHQALLYHVIGALYEDPRNMNIDLANRFDTKYLAIVNEAKKVARNNYTSTGFIKGVHF